MCAARTYLYFTPVPGGDDTDEQCIALDPGDTRPLAAVVGRPVEREVLVSIPGLRPVAVHPPLPPLPHLRLLTPARLALLRALRLERLGQLPAAAALFREAAERGEDGDKSVAEARAGLERVAADPPLGKGGHHERPVGELLREAAAAEGQRAMKKARGLYRAALERDPACEEAAQGLGRVALAAGLHEAGLAAVEAGLAAHPSSTALHSLCADLHIALRNWDAAFEHLKVVCAGSAREDVRLGICLYEAGLHAHAGPLFLRLARDHADPEAEAWLSVYLAEAESRPAEAVPIALRALSALAEHPALRPRLAPLVVRTLQAAGEEATMAAIDEVLPGQEGAAGVAWLGVVVKEHGMARLAARLLGLAACRVPAHPAYTLSLVHTLELEFHYAEALRAAANLLEALPLPHPVPVRTVARLLRRVDVDAVRRRAETEGVCEEGNVEDYAQPKDNVAEARELEGADLDVLAVCFTVAKILFLNGALTTVRALIEALEPIREQQPALHTTHIRNEAAYYSAVQGLLRDTPIEPGPPASPLYVVGDSHILALAWRRVGGFRCVPVLVTGVKLWHLRPESVFYPKTNFLAALDKVPTHAPLMLIMGEIDCREGLLRAVEKGVYEDLPAALAALVALYRDVLTTHVLPRPFPAVLIHPAPPVLDIVRPIVRAFNAMLGPALGGLEGRVEYVDVGEALLDGQGSLGSAFSFDGTHLHPHYIPLLAPLLSRTQTRLQGRE